MTMLMADTERKLNELFILGRQEWMGINKIDRPNVSYILAMSNTFTYRNSTIRVKDDKNPDDVQRDSERCLSETKQTIKERIYNI